MSCPPTGLVTFDSSSSDPTAGGSDKARVISWQVNDGSDPSNAATTTIQVVGVDHHPVGTAGDDGFYFGPAFLPGDTVDGGAGTNDQIGLYGDCSAGLTFGATAMTGVEVVACLAGFSYNLTTVDANVAAGATLTIWAVPLGAGNTLTFNGSAETDGKFIVYGGAGNDVVQGGAGDDIFYGLGGADILTSGGGADTFAYTAISESTGNANGTAYDTIVNFESSDRFDIPGSGLVFGVDATVSGPTLSSASFDTDLAAAIGTGQLASNHAVLFQAGAGTLAGHDFVVVDINGVAGYQSGADFVIEIVHSAPIVLTTANFI